MALIFPNNPFLGTNHSNSSQASSNQANTSQANTSQVNSNQVNAGQRNSNQRNTNQVNSNQRNTNQVNSNQRNTNQVNSNQRNTNQVNSNERNTEQENNKQLENQYNNNGQQRRHNQNNPFNMNRGNNYTRPDGRNNTTNNVNRNDNNNSNNTSNSNAISNNNVNINNDGDTNNNPNGNINHTANQNQNTQNNINSNRRNYGYMNSQYNAVNSNRNIQSSNDVINEKISYADNKNNSYNRNNETIASGYNDGDKNNNSNSRNNRVVHIDNSYTNKIGESDIINPVDNYNSSNSSANDCNDCSCDGATLSKPSGQYVLNLERRITTQGAESEADNARRSKSEEVVRVSSVLEDRNQRNRKLSYKVDKPYPPTDVKEKNEEYAVLLLADYAGAISELTAVTSYSFLNLVISDEYKEVREAYRGISIVEMHHLQMLGELIQKLGVLPRFYSRDKNNMTMWNASFVSGDFDFNNTINDSIKNEEAGIENYKKHCSVIDDEGIKSVLERIILDEELHVKILQDLKKKYCKEL